VRPPSQDDVGFTLTRHAKVRAQQRGIRQTIIQLGAAYGELHPDSQFPPFSVRLFL